MKLCINDDNLITAIFFAGMPNSRVKKTVWTTRRMLRNASTTSSSRGEITRQSEKPSKSASLRKTRQAMSFTRTRKTSREGRFRSGSTPLWLMGSPCRNSPHNPWNCDFLEVKDQYFSVNLKSPDTITYSSLRASFSGPMCNLYTSECN